MELLFLILAFCGGALLIFGANLVIADVMEAHRQRIRVRLDEELRLRQRERARSTVVYKEVYEMAAAGVMDIRVRPTLRERLTKLVDESGIVIRPRQLLILCAMVGALITVPVGALSGRWGLGGALGAASAAAPFLYVSMARARRREKLLAQLPDAFDLMSRSMRAGQTMSQALQVVSEEFSSPIAEEFGFCYDQQNLGLSPEAAMRDLARRTGLLELRIFVLAVMIHRQTGGNLAELLGKLSNVIRQRYRIRGAIKSFTAEGRLQAVILLLLPPVLLGVMTLVNRPYAATLFQHPALLAATGISMLVGGAWMQRIVSFDF
jgi:tight adherence protein B